MANRSGAPSCAKWVDRPASRLSKRTTRNPLAASPWHNESGQNFSGTEKPMMNMEGSTGLAERLGPLAFHRLLNRFVTDLTDPIVAARGEIYSYVGDELIARWKLEEGISQARCVRACFNAFDALARKALEYRREFGAAVNFRAGLHCGPLVIGEMGSIKTEIVFLGDTVNTAARIQDVCRQTGDRILASADLIDRVQLPPGIVK